MRDDAARASKMLAAVSHQALLSVLCSAQRDICGVCRNRMGTMRTVKNQYDANRPTLEHVVPKSLQGYDGRGNLFAAHARCNNAKGDRYPTEAELQFLSDVNVALGWPDRSRRWAA